MQYGVFKEHIVYVKIKNIGLQHWQNSAVFQVNYSEVCKENS